MASNEWAQGISAFLSTLAGNKQLKQKIQYEAEMNRRAIQADRIKQLREFQYQKDLLAEKDRIDDENREAEFENQKSLDLYGSQLNVFEDIMGGKGTPSSVRYAIEQGILPYNQPEIPSYKNVTGLDEVPTSEIRMENWNTVLPSGKTLAETYPEKFREEMFYNKAVNPFLEGLKGMAMDNQRLPINEQYPQQLAQQEAFGKAGMFPETMVPQVQEELLNQYINSFIPEPEFELKGRDKLKFQTAMNALQGGVELPWMLPFLSDVLQESIASKPDVLTGERDVTYPTVEKPPFSGGQQSYGVGGIATDQRPTQDTSFSPVPPIYGPVGEQPVQNGESQYSSGIQYDLSRYTNDNPFKGEIIRLEGLYEESIKRAANTALLPSEQAQALRDSETLKGNISSAVRQADDEQLNIENRGKYTPPPPKPPKKKGKPTKDDRFNSIKADIPTSVIGSFEKPRYKKAPIKSAMRDLNDKYKVRFGHFMDSDEWNALLPDVRGAYAKWLESKDSGLSAADKIMLERYGSK